MSFLWVWDSGGERIHQPEWIQISSTVKTNKSRILIPGILGQLPIDTQDDF